MSAPDITDLVIEWQEAVAHALVTGDPGDHEAARRALYRLRDARRDAEKRR